MAQQSFTDPQWQAIFQSAGYTDFDSWWNAEGSLVEEGNFRGKDQNISWSHVSRIQLSDGRTVYLKRQQNHYPNNLLLKYIRRLTTFEIEWKNYQRFQKAGIPSMNIVYFGHRKHNGNRQSIIVSEELKGMTALDELIYWFEKNHWPTREQRHAIVKNVAKTIKKLHNAGIIHNALYGRHLYINLVPNDDGTITIPKSIQSCFIDLERAKYPGANSPKCVDRDLKTLHSKTKAWPAKDKFLFLKTYLGIDKPTAQDKTQIKQIIARVQ